MQSWFVIFLLLSGCVTAPPPLDLNAWIPEGTYHFKADTVNQNNLARVTHEKGRMRVTLLGDFEGGFTFDPKADGGLGIVDADMDYPGLKRTFKGEGRVTKPGIASGTSVMWLKSAGPVSRNHRKGPWFLRPATEAEIQKFERKAAARNERLERAKEAGLEVPERP